MPETVKQCPLCGHRQSRSFDRRTFRNQAVKNRICTRCGLVYQTPRKTAEELDNFYEAEYRRLYQGGEGPGRKDLVIQGGRAESLLHFSRGRLPAPKRHLDIGASAGTLAMRFQAYYNNTAVGIEPGLAYREYAQKLGLKVYPSLEDLAAAGEGRFDLISMAHVLEHLPDPVGYLVELRQTFLSPEGWLLIEVPNLYAHNCFEVAHLTSFSQHSLHQVLAKAGFEISMTLQHGQPRSVVLPLYLTMLAYPSTEPGTFSLQPERAVALKRRVGLLRRRILQRLVPSLAWVPLG